MKPMLSLLMLSKNPCLQCGNEWISRLQGEGVPEGGTVPCCPCQAAALSPPQLCLAQRGIYGVFCIFSLLNPCKGSSDFRSIALFLLFLFREEELCLEAHALRMLLGKREICHFPIAAFPPAPVILHLNQRQQLKAPPRLAGKSCVRWKDTGKCL